MKLLTSAAIAAIAVAATPASAEMQHYSVIFGGKSVGHLNADVEGDRASIDFDYKNNGRGPTMKEQVRLDAQGLPVDWRISGTTTFGSKVEERFARNGAGATWTDATGPGSAPQVGRAVYVAQSGSPWSAGLYARATMKTGGDTITALPGGTLKLVRGETLSVRGRGGPLQVTRHELGGIETAPETILLEADGDLFAHVSPRQVIVRAGYENEAERLKTLAAQWSTDRFVAIQRKVAHRYGAPVRIRDVRVFDPKMEKLTGRVSVLVSGNRVAAVEAADRRAAGEVVIDGAGGTLVPGLYEMHAHTSQEGALLNIAAGVTSMRDMGNDNAVLDKLIERIDGGVIAGPRITRAGFIEGKSPFSANNGILVDSEAEAVTAAHWYADRGYWGVKSYNSMNPAWIPAMVKEAHARGLKVVGHVPAFATADQMLEAGFDEMVHINQFMLGWVIQPTEDTRTLFRLTALKRLPGLDLNSPKVQRTIGLMVDRRVPIDVTLGIHENLLLLNRDGRTPHGAVDYIDHLPIGTQRSMKQAWIDASAPGDDLAYRGAYDKIVETIRMLNGRGVMIIPGTDTGGSFTFHRELELYQNVGMTPSQILKRATLDMARYLGQEATLGSVEQGKLADFFLVPGDPTRDLKAIKSIAMVVKDGAFYFPAEIHPEFGIKPFAAPPTVAMPARR